jgi:transcriptional regulator with XRE-family HTH domain
LAQFDYQSNVIDVHVGARIRLRRKLLRVSLRCLADDLGLTFQQVQKYERGVNRVSASKLYEISRSLQISAHYFFEGLTDYGHDCSDHTGPERTGMEFLTTPEGFELASLFPRLNNGHARRGILDLVRAMVENGEEAAPAPSARARAARSLKRRSDRLAKKGTGLDARQAGPSIRAAP